MMSMRLWTSKISSWMDDLTFVNAKMTIVSNSFHRGKGFSRKVKDKGAFTETCDIAPSTSKETRLSHGNEEEGTYQHAKHDCKGGQPGIATQGWISAVQRSCSFRGR